MVAQVQQMRALLECVWPASLDTAKHPFRSVTWAAAITEILHPLLPNRRLRANARVVR